MNKLAILNTTILTNDGYFQLKTISLEVAKKIVEENKDNLLSAIGHESTSKILTELLGIEIPVNRIQFCQELKQVAICFKLNGRPEEGKILSKEEIKDIGFEFKLLTMIESTTNYLKR